MRVKVLFHDHCFDGAASAAFFSRFYEGAIQPDVEFAFQGLAHGVSQQFQDSMFDGDENAIVDFKYSSHPRLTWWFDHHQSAFLTPQEAEHFRRDTSGRKLYDPSFKSCTLFIAQIAKARFGFAAPDLDDLVHWADIIDGAQYPDAKTAVDLGAPAMQLTLVIEAAKSPGLVERVIRWMRHEPLGAIMAKPEIADLYAPLHERHVRSIGLIRDRAGQQGRVLFFDLTGCDMEGYNKFIPYYLFPDSTYTVSVSPSATRVKISVGSNPWAPEEPSHNLASICERYGGGGHPRVGAISMAPDALDRARQAASEIVALLNREPE
ncbi:MAG: phosphoesterase [Bryobacterales bacterium]|nr:phosphoesterase [Bryobacterales bacterium]